MWSSDDAISGRGASEFVSECENIAGLAGTLGFSALLAGGGSEALLSLRSDGLVRPLEAGSPGESRCIVSPIGTDDPSCGVVGRGDVGDTLPETDSRL